MPAVAKGQEYEACHPLDNIRIRVMADPVALDGKAEIATVLPDGRTARPRLIEMRQLHDSPTRKTGYRLVKDADGGGA